MTRKERQVAPELIPPPYEWTPEKRARLIEMWVDSGDIASARDAVGVTPSEFLRELDRNEDFADAVKTAAPLADRMLEERAYELALKGNDKLLAKILTAKYPEYRESLKLDLNASTTLKMDDAQLKAYLVRLLNKYQGAILEAEAVEVPKLEAPDDAAAPVLSKPVVLL